MKQVYPRLNIPACKPDTNKSLIFLSIGPLERIFYSNKDLSHKAMAERKGISDIIEEHSPESVIKGYYTKMGERKTIEMFNNYLFSDYDKELFDMEKELFGWCKNWAYETYFFTLKTLIKDGFDLKTKIYVIYPGKKNIKEKKTGNLELMFSNIPGWIA